MKWRIIVQTFILQQEAITKKPRIFLRRKVNDRLRSEIGSRTIKDIVSGSRGELNSAEHKSLKCKEMEQGLK